MRARFLLTLLPMLTAMPQAAPAEMARAPCMAKGGELMAVRQSNVTLCNRFLRTLRANWPAGKPWPDQMRTDLRNRRFVTLAPIETMVSDRRLDLRDIDRLARATALTLSTR
jgi:hypothetical protein